MYQNSREIKPLDWEALVEETLRRRKAEKITQREHAALASVSVPTMADFERVEKSLTLAKAFDILRVVGLVSEPKEMGGQDIFVRDAFERWCELTASLPKDELACFPHGYFRFDYYLEGIKPVKLNHFKDILIRSNHIHYSGWPPFFLRREDKKRCYEKEGIIECWSLDTEIEKASFGPSNDFWRASPQGYMFLMRGYKEDGQEAFSPGSVLDITIPIYRMAEVLLHAWHMASCMTKEDNETVTVHFRALYTGLSGRLLRSWSDPHYFLSGEYAARSNEVSIEGVVNGNNIESNLVDCLYPLASKLYERFGLINLERNLVQKIVDRLLAYPKKSILLAP